MILRLDYIASTQTYSLSIPFRVSGEWDPGSLLMEETVDEDGRKSISVKDVWGNLVCQRSFSASSDTLDTYYIHDLHKNIVCIIQPEGSAILKTEQYSATDVEAFCFQYRYDGRVNKLRQKVPGGAWEDLYYDPRNRLIASTDEELIRNNIFHWIQYDNLDRVVRETYVKCPGKTASSIRADLYYGSMVFQYQPDINKIPVVEKAYYTSGYSLPSGMELNGYSGIVSTQDILPLEGYPAYEKVYDVPNLDGKIRSSRSYVERSFGYNSLGQLVVSKERDENRVDDIQMTVWYKYNQLGNIIQTVEHHAPYAEAPIGTIYAWNDYDDRGRLLKTTRKIDSVSLSAVEYAYDDMGRIFREEICGGENQTVAQQLWAFNLQGRVINSTALLGSGQVFQEQLHYYDCEAPLSDPQWAGNISEYISRQGSEDPVTNSYYYDSSSRLSWRINSSTSESYRYNRNGGVTGFSSNSGGVTQNRSLSYSGNRVIQVDTSSYAYDARGNRITDTRNGLQISYNTLNLPAVVRKTDMTDSARFVYLADGTKLKTIDKDGHVVRYRGSLVIKQNSESGGEIIAGALWDEGFTELSGSWWSGWTARDVWYVKDYLGNVRGKYDLTNLTEISRSDYTPYGERLDVSTTPQSTSYPAGWDGFHRRHFGGKEEVGDGGLNLLDFGARYYDPYSFSWTSVDPLTEKEPSITPFSYCLNNPTVYIDPDGRLSLFPYGLPLNPIRNIQLFSYHRKVKTIAYSIQNPSIAVQVGKYDANSLNISSVSSFFALNLARSMGYSTNTEGDMTNAIRHVIWQGIITSAFGEGHAKQIGLAHENGTPDTSKRIFKSFKEADSVIDLLNNEIGVSIGLTETNNLSIAQKAIDVLIQDGLWTATEHNGFIVIQRTKITEEQYNNALNELSKLTVYGHEKKDPFIDFSLICNWSMVTLPQ